MEAKKSIFTVIKTENEKVETILKNTLVMLGNRIYLDKQKQRVRLLVPEDAEKTVEDKGDQTFMITASNSDVYVLKIVFQKITTTGKQSVINEFIEDYPQNKKILVAKEFNNKIYDYGNRHQTQILREDSLLEDIIVQKDQPKFEVLTPSEAQQFKLEYNANDYTIKKLLKNDPVTKYFALKKGDVVRIIRPSPTSGSGIDYRIVM